MSGVDYFVHSKRDYLFGDSIGKSFEKFFENYSVKENIEIHYFFSSPWGDGTSIDDLKKIKFKEKIIFLVARDSLISKERFNFYKTKNVEFMSELDKMCSNYPDKIFILFANQGNLNNLIESKNLFCTAVVNFLFKEKYQRCKIKNISDTPWVSFNSGLEPHRAGLLSWMLSKNLDKHGKSIIDKNFFNDHHLLNRTFDFFKLNESNKKQFQKGFEKLKRKKFNYKSIQPYNTNISSVKNFNTFLLPVYETSALEIIAGSLFFEPTPFFSEKEIQASYGKVFPIFISNKGSVKYFEDWFDFDVFRDIIDHSYDDIDDPTDRLISAIDLNIDLLNGKTDLKKLWNSCQDRFDKNCDKMDQLHYNYEYQYQHDREKIKEALDFFSIKNTKK